MSTEETWWPSRYGADDQLGALNEITPAKTAAAARLVRSGKTYDLGRTLHAEVPRFEGRYWQQSLVSAAHLINRRKPGGRAGGWGANQINWITELVTGTLQIGTHLDGLNHLQIGDRFYNGWRAEEIVEDWGTSKLGIETVPPIITRGVLAEARDEKGREGESLPGYGLMVADGLASGGHIDLDNGTNHMLAQRKPGLVGGETPHARNGSIPSHSRPAAMGSVAGSQSAT